MNVRSRFNTKFSGFENDHVAVAAFVFAVEPLVKYLISSTSLSYLKTQGRTATALHVHELFMIISARTRITKQIVQCSTQMTIGTESKRGFKSSW